MGMWAQFFFTLEHSVGPYDVTCCVLLQLVLKLWGDELNARPADLKRTFRGKLASATHTQTVDYIKPLFKSLKKKVHVTSC